MDSATNMCRSLGRGYRMNRGLCADVRRAVNHAYGDDRVQLSHSIRSAPQNIDGRRLTAEECRCVRDGLRIISRR